MLSVDRENSIKQILYKQNSVTVSELSCMFGVSGETIRRDLQRISAEDPMIVRVHGGAYRATPDSEAPYNFRQSSMIDEKKRIAARCFQEIKEGDFLFLDSSTTTLYLSKLIATSGLELTVMTNSLGILNELCASDSVRIIALGGRYTDRSHSFVGHSTLAELSGLLAGKAFVSCSGLDMTFGLTHSDEEEAAIRSAMLRNSKERYVLIDSKKFGHCKTHGIMSMDDVNAVFTDAAPDEHWLSFFKEHEARLIVCK